MKDQNTYSYVSISPMFLLFLTFLTLKLTEVIDWSWWWITAPLWGPAAFLVGIFIVVFPILWLTDKKQ